MNKGLILFIILSLGMIALQHNQIAEANLASTIQMIPDEAIRLRILANSDSDADQRVKLAVRDNVNAYVSELVQHIDHIEKAREVVASHVPEISRIVERTLTENSLEQSFEVAYRTNVTFPLKVYGPYLYPAGEYEAVLITLGEGAGANWWCVLFPPLCFLDFSKGPEVADATSDDDEENEDQQENDAEEITEEEEKVEVKFFLFEWLGLS